MTTRSKATAPEEVPEEVVPENADTGAILADPSIITLSDGKQYNVERLKTLGTLKLLKIFTAGASDVLMQTKFSVDMDPKEFTGIFIGALLFSVPEQSAETLDFIQNMVSPKHVIRDARTPQERESNEQMFTEMYLLLEDPEIEDTVSILTAIITIEGPHILSLGKRLTAILGTMRAGRAPKQTPIK